MGPMLRCREVLVVCWCCRRRSMTQTMTMLTATIRTTMMRIRAMTVSDIEELASEDGEEIHRLLQAVYGV